MRTAFSFAQARPYIRCNACREMRIPSIHFLRLIWAIRNGRINAVKWLAVALERNPEYASLLPGCALCLFSKAELSCTLPPLRPRGCYDLTPFIEIKVMQQNFLMILV
jgi:hypothetical protein